MIKMLTVTKKTGGGGGEGPGYYDGGFGVLFLF